MGASDCPISSKFLQKHPCTSLQQAGGVRNLVNKYSFSLSQRHITNNMNQKPPVQWILVVIWKCYTA